MDALHCQAGEVGGGKPCGDDLHPGDDVHHGRAPCGVVAEHVAEQLPQRLGP